MSQTTDRDPLCPCTGAAAPADEHAGHQNSPGQPALSYRIATQSGFFRRMLADLSTQEVDGTRPLSRLRGRSTADFSIALLDAAAVVGDVLTFYQERIANEGYLRTATERRSVLELARAAGHELQPGVSAEAHLAFTVEELPSSGGIAKVPAGTQVESIPGPEQAAQTFEVAADTEIRSQWNELRLRLTQPPTLVLPNSAEPQLPICSPLPEARTPLPCLFLAGTDLDLEQGDELLFVNESPPRMAPLLCTIYRVTLDVERNRTRVELTPQTDDRVLGRLTPPPVQIAGVIDATPHRLTAADVRGSILGRSWSEQALDSQIALQGWSAQELLLLLASEQQKAVARSDVAVYAFRKRVSFFGHNRPAIPYLATAPSGLADDVWRTYLRNTFGQNHSIFRTAALAAWPAGAHTFLERELAEVTAGSYLVLVDAGAPAGARRYRALRIAQVLTASISDGGLSDRATGLLFEPDDLTGIDQADATTWNFRTTLALVQSERLPLAPLPIIAPVDSGSASLMLDRMVLGLKPQQPVWLRGEILGSPGVSADEIVSLSSIVHSDGYSVLSFEPPLVHAYARATVTVNANVALAHHGESAQREVLGSGDAAQSNQRFVLKRRDLAFSAAPTRSGVASGITVQVNGIPWAEVETLFGRGPNERAYTVRTSDDGQIEIEFGDGVNGARLPSGRENIEAAYRTADTSAGNVPAGSLSLLKTHPLGVRDVVNPLPASGGTAPASLSQARQSAAVETRTLGRLVTLSDYELFAATFAGIAKVRADLLSDASGNVVYLSVAARSGERLDVTVQNLVGAASALCDPLQRVEIGLSTPSYFHVDAQLVLAPGTGPEVYVMARAALLAAFSIERREFGQDVSAAEVIHALQGVPGVVAALLNELYLLGSPNRGVEQLLSARGAVVLRSSSEVSFRPAELVLIHPLEIRLTEVSA